MDLLREFPEPAQARFGIARVEAIGLSPRQIAWYRETDQRLTTIDSVADLHKAINSSIRNPNIGTEATGAFLSDLEHRRDREKEATRGRHAERRSALRENGHRVLKQATYVSLARQDTLFGTEELPMTKQAILSMLRTEGFPFGPLAKLAGIEFHLSATDPEWLTVCGKSRASLDGRMQHLRNQAADLLEPLATTPPEQPSVTAQTEARVTLL